MKYVLLLPRQNLAEMLLGNQELTELLNYL